MVNAMELLQGWKAQDQQNALRAAQMEQMRAEGMRSAQMHPLQIEAAQMNMLAKRQAMQQDQMRRNALQQYGATGNVNALAMGDPEMAAKVRMMQDRMTMRGGGVAGAAGTRGAAGAVKPTWDATRGVFIVPPTPENPQGTVIQPQGLPNVAKEDKPLTETQGNATGFGLRAARSHEILTGLEDQGVTNTGIIKSGVTGVAEMVPFIGDKLGEAAGSLMNTVPGVLGGPNSQQQQTEQARRDFVNAVLRKESGAVISPSEFMNASKQYFPQPGDTDDVIEQKRQNRLSALESLRIQAGPGAKNIPKPAKSIKSVPQGVDPKLWAVMTPEERAAWQ